MKNEKKSKTNARLMAVQALYAHHLTETDLTTLITDWTKDETDRKVILDLPKLQENEFIEPDLSYFKKIIKSYQEHTEDIDSLIRSSLSDSELFEKLDLLLVCILRAGFAEFYANPSLDNPIIINEYTTIAQSFFNTPSVNLVNAVLDKKKQTFAF